MNHKDLEIAAMRAWPATEETQHQGLILRASDGYTKRANSINVIETFAGDLSAALLFCEEFYKTRKLPSIFRVCDYCDNRSLKTALCERAYTSRDKTFVMTCDLNKPSSTPATTASAASAASVTINKAQASSWLQAFSDISELDFNHKHLKILERIEDPCFYLVNNIDGKAQCCGLGVANGDLIGLFDIACHKTFRRRGLAENLIKHLLDLAADAGAKKAYLQVVANNTAAINLYQKMGFKTAYSYEYFCLD